MAWIESHQSIGQHPKTRRAARRLGVSIPAMVGHLHLLWHWALDYAQDGDISPYEHADIADAAMWEGEPETFVSALIDAGPGQSAGFLAYDEEERLVIHDWWEYAGKLIVKRQADAERKRAARSNNAPGPDGGTKQDVHKMSNGRPADVQPPSQVNQPTVNQPTKNPLPPKRETMRAERPPDDDKALPEPTESQPFLAVAAMCERLGTDPHVLDSKGLGKQCRKAKELLDRNFTVDEIGKYTGFLASQHWRDDPIDMFTIAKGIAGWRLNGSLAVAESRASPRSRRQNMVHEGHQEYPDFLGMRPGDEEDDDDNQRRPA